MAPLRAQDDPVVARVNGTDVRQSDLAMAEEDLGGNMPQMTPEAKRDYLITFVGDMMLVAKAAEAKKFGDRRRLQAQARLCAHQAADGTVTSQSEAKAPSPKPR